MPRCISFSPSSFYRTPFSHLVQFHATIHPSNHLPRSLKPPPHPFNTLIQFTLPLIYTRTYSPLPPPLSSCTHPPTTHPSHRNALATYHPQRFQPQPLIHHLNVNGGGRGNENGNEKAMLRCEKKVEEAGAGEWDERRV